MIKNKLLVKLVACIIGVAMVIPTVASNQVYGANTTGVNPTVKEEINFDYVKKHSKVQTFASDAGGNVNIYVTTLHVDPLNKAKEVVIYGQLAFPLTSQDIGVETIGTKLFLPKDENYINFNEHIKAYMIWAPEDTNGTYDKQIFKKEDNTWVKGDTIKLVLKGQSFDIKIPQEAATLDTSYLEGAIAEHWNDYQAVLSSGLLIEKSSKEQYLAANDKALKFVEEAKKPDTKITSEQVELMRKELNTAFGDLLPEPFPREKLEKLSALAKEKIQNNGNNNTRYTKDTFEQLLDAYSTAIELVNLKDLKAVVIPKHGEPIYTHKDFNDAEKKLEEKILALKEEKYKSVDTSNLEKKYFEAIEKTPSKDHGFAVDSRNDFYDEIDKVSYLLSFEKPYKSQSDIDNAEKALVEKTLALKEEKLDTSKKFNINVKYVHPVKGAVTSLIKDYFKDDKGNAIEEHMEVVLGQEVRIPVDSEIVKKFDGYVASSFHYNSDDGTLKLVRVLKDAKGKEIVIFKADTNNLVAGAPLVISYEEGSAKSENTSVVDKNNSAANDSTNATNPDKKAGAVGKNPKTGEEGNTLGYLMAMVISGISLVALTESRRKKVKN